MKMKPVSFNLPITTAVLMTAASVNAADAPKLKFGEDKTELIFGGLSRNYMTYAPNACLSGRPLPLIISLHGTGGTAASAIDMGHFQKWAELEGFIVAAPQSLGQAFNDGSGRGGAAAEDVDDVGFIRAVIADVKTKARIDEKRIYMVGFSSGGAMAQRFALESDSEVAAFAALSDAFYIPDRKPAAIRPLLLMWGTADPLNPIRGGKVRYGRVTLDKPAPMTTAEGWAKKMGCSASPEQHQLPNGVAHYIWSGCQGNARLELYFIDGMGHHWAGGKPVPYPASVIGKYSNAVDATKIILDFFESKLC
ncbi:MAG: alpha/beta fold hydrolase [Deltaproteobacteria bacterium]|nr:alpha/beta fold hydrolase [Deltaproteobacteria bacterium]